MKNTKILFVIIMLISIVACEDLSEINKNPNNVSETHPQLLLTKVTADAFKVKGTSSMNAMRMIVNTDGESETQYYKWSRSNFDDYEALRDVTKMLEEGKRIKSDAYMAIAKFLRAYYFFNLTQTFGDIPYSEALKGEFGEYTPTYDTQKDVFIGILNELKEANQLLKNNNEIVQGDIIYSGDVSKWRKLINSFRLKIPLSLSKKTGTTDIDIQNLFRTVYSSEPIIQSLEDNAQLVFFDQEGSRYTEFNSSSYGSGRYMASPFIDMLKARKDPRLFIFCGRTKKAKEDGLAINNFDAYNGGDPTIPYGEVNKQAAAGLVSKVNLRYTTNPTTEPHNLLSYWEIEFILAEATTRGWITSDAKKHYENGIKASFEFYSKYANSFKEYVSSTEAEKYLKQTLVDFDKATGQAGKIQYILTQKYFTSFLQGGWSSFFEHLRTGYPEFITATGVTVPTRWMYPQSEYINNTENVSKAIERQFGAGNDKTRETPWWLK